MGKKVGKSGITLPPVRIEKLVHGGAGFGFAGRPVFIPLTAAGDLVVPERVRQARGVFFAEPGQFLECSRERRETPCPWFGECGGCQWMHLDYEDQIQWKATVVQEVLNRIGKLGCVKFEGVHRSPAEWGYRHRARIQVAGGKAGFFRRRSKSVVTWDRCLLLPDRLNSAISILRSLIAGKTITPDPVSLEVALSHVDGGLTLRWELARGSVSGHGLQRAAITVEKELAGAGHRTMGQVFLDTRGKSMFLRGTALDLKVGESRLKVSPGTFCQVNPWTNELLVEKVLNLLKRRGVGELLDLYCGNGNFSIPAALAGIRTHGVDSNPAGILDARDMAGADCHFHVQDVGRFLDESRRRWDAVLVDPPRTGLTNHVAQRLVALRSSVLAYVSCEPATLARDLTLLFKGGFILRNIELFDMFPQTPHTEILVELEK